MKATIWHNPNCGTSRKALARLQESPDILLTVVEYLKTPPSRATLQRLYDSAGITPRQGLRTRCSPAEELNLSNASGDAILICMEKNPSLIERPLVETEKGVRLCRPIEVLEEIL